MAESLPRLKVGPGLAKQSCDGPGSVAMIESLIMAVFLSTAGLTSVGVGGIAHDRTVFQVGCRVIVDRDIVDLPSPRS